MIMSELQRRRQRYVHIPLDHNTDDIVHHIDRFYVRTLHTYILLILVNNILQTQKQNQG